MIEEAVKEIAAETEVQKLEEDAKIKEKEPYWYVDYVGFEQKQKETNRLILGLRYWSPEGTRKKKVFFNQKVKIPTKLIHRRNRKELAKVVETWRNNPELHKHKLTVFLSQYDEHHAERLKQKYPGLEVQIREGQFDVFQLELPYNRELINTLGSDFQNASYDRNFRFEHDLLYKKVKFKFIDDILNFFNISSELAFDSIDSLSFFPDRISASELREQAWFYADIEKPLFKSHEEKRDLDRREYLIELRRAKKAKFRRKLEEIVTKNEGRKSMEQINAQIGRIVNRLEGRLTKQIGGHEIKLWEEEYDAKISWYTFILKKADGSEVRQLHTLRDCGLKEINGYEIVLHKTERELLNAVIKIMKENNIAVFSNHNLPYDVTQTRFAAEETKADSFDLFIDNIFPRRDFVRKAYQRMKKDIEYIDSYRLAVVFHPWLKDKKLETFAQDRLGEKSFEKSLTYAEMRELEIKSIKGDKEAAKLLADYATRDVEPVKKIVEESHYIDTIFKIRDIFPFLTLTEIAFSPRCVKKYFDWKHWQKNKNNRNFGYTRKIIEHEEQIFKKRFEPLKRAYMTQWAVEIPNIKGIHNNVVQAYVPIEQWLKDIICRVEPKWEGYYNSLSNDPIERFGQLRYPREFLKEFLKEHYFAVNEQKRYQRRIKTLGRDEQAIDYFLDEFERNADSETLGEYITSLRNLRNQYRSIYVKLNEDSRKLIRVPKRFYGEANMRFDFSEFFESDNGDFIELKENAKELSKRLNEGQRKELKRFLSNFDTYYNKNVELVKYAPKNIPGLRAENLVYLYALRESYRRKASRFWYEYGISINEVTAALKKGYESLRDELYERKIQAICHKGDYLFLKGGNLENLKTLIPIRKFDSYIVESSNANGNEDSKDLFYNV